MEKYTLQEKEYLVKLGYKVKITRKTKRMTQDQIAEICNSQKAHLSRLECGIKNPTVLTLKKIAEALQVPVAIFFDVDNAHQISPNANGR